jgi:hypothetical protein
MLGQAGENSTVRSIELTWPVMKLQINKLTKDKASVF